MSAPGNTKIYVGNLSWGTTDESLRDAFAAFGQISDSIVMRDRDTGRSRGFGFVTYQTPDEAEQAIRNLHDTDLDGRRIKVNIANARGSGGGGGFNGGGYSGGGYNGQQYSQGYQQPYNQQPPYGGYGGGYGQQGQGYNNQGFQGGSGY